MLSNRKVEFNLVAELQMKRIRGTILSEIFFLFHGEEVTIRKLPQNYLIHTPVTSRQPSRQRPTNATDINRLS